MITILLQTVCPVKSLTFLVPLFNLPLADNRPTGVSLAMSVAWAALGGRELVFGEALTPQYGAVHAWALIYISSSSTLFCTCSLPLWRVHEIKRMYLASGIHSLFIT